MLYTAQYRYSGIDRLDITVKGGDRTFAPTWDMVMDYKKTGDEAAYIALYYPLLIQRHAFQPDPFMNLVEKSKAGDVTVVCFCPSGSFCHRYLLARFLRHNWQVAYGGERKI